MLGLMHVRLPTTRPWIGVTVIGMTLLSLSPGSAHAQLVPETAPHITPAQLDALRTSLENAARAELTAKDLPSVALAIVTRDGIVLEFFLGFEDEARTRPVTEATVFRMGSISKMLTGVTAMIAQEEGLLELDAAVVAYVPELRKIPGGERITLRQLLSHRAGLVREPPIGYYTDPTEPTLRSTVASVAETELVHEPGARIKYSNAGFAIVGQALEAVYEEPFSDVVRSRLLDRLGMTSSWTSRLEIPRDRLAYAQMWVPNGERYSPPLFDFGMGPAGFLYATVPDLAKFVAMLLSEGMTADGPIVQPAALHDMWSPQTPDHADHWNEPCFGDCTRGSMEVGLAADLNRPFEGFTRVRHGGGVFGYASELEILPEAGVGVIVVTTLDSHGRVSRHLAAAALRGFVAAMRGETLPEISVSSEVVTQVSARVAAARADAEGSAAATRGAFGDERYGVEIIDETEDELVILVEGVELVRLHRTGSDAFRFPRFSLYGDEPLTLVRGQNGVVDRVRIGTGRGMLLERVGE